MSKFRVWDGIAIFLLGLLAFILFSMLFDMQLFVLHKQITLPLIFYACIHNRWLLLTVCISPVIGGIAWYMLSDRHNLDISRDSAGNGQYGDARFMTRREKKKTFLYVKKKHEDVPGFVIEYDKHGWWVDTSDQSMLMVSPPGGGKTTGEFEPTIRYNAAVCRRHPETAASMIITDAKGTLISAMGGTVKKAGYAVLALDFRHPLQSYQYNLMHNVNVHMDKSKAADNREDEILEQAQAEKFAKVLADSIVKNTGASSSSTSESSEYFDETSKGLLTAIILMVSEYGRGEERHIISVFRLIVELNGLSEGSTETLQKNRLESLMEVLPENHRAKLFAGASTKADIRTSMNIFSSALGKLVSFIDAQLEQMICNHSAELNTDDFIQKPTAIFLVIPDDDTTTHFFASLYIRNVMNELIAIAERQPFPHLLPRRVICEWDEFGQIPPIKEFDVLITAARSRGVRFTLALQSMAQLENRYTQPQMKIIRDALQMTLFSRQAPTAIDTAKLFSSMLGNYTTHGGSVSRGDRSDSHSIQLMGRPLMTVDEIITIPRGKWVLVKSGKNPLPVHLPSYDRIYKGKPEALPVEQRRHVQDIPYLTEEKIRLRAQAAYIITPGMFDID